MEIKAWQRLRITVVMAIAYTAEHAEAMLLGAMYLAIGRSLDIGAAQLGTLSMWRALVQAFSIPFVGVAGNIYNRMHLIAAGTVIWGCMGLGMGFSDNYAEAAAWCALNGVGLALVLPCVQSIIAEVYRSKSRGKAFGIIFTTSAFGGMACNFLAITFANKQVGPYEGWRVIFFTTAGIAAGATAVVLFGGIEPRSLRPKEKVDENAPKQSFLRAAGTAVRDILKATWSVFRIRSFQIILVAGIIGAIAHVNNGYKVMYFQLLGFSDLATATLSTCTTLGLAVGFFLGGAFGDALSIRFPNASRPFINQLSMGLAGPLAIVLYKAMPGNSRFATGVPGSLDHLLPVYGALLFVIGQFSSWPASNNAAIFADVVPEAVRTSVYAFDKCIIGALGAVTTPLAGLLAEKAFGFKHISKHAKGAVWAPASAGAGATQAANNLNNARALENGLLCIMLIPMALKFFIYFGLYYTLPRDRIEEFEESETKEASPAKGDKGKGDEEPGSPREPEGQTLPAKSGNATPSLPKPPGGSRSLRQTSSFGSTRYSSLPTTGIVSRDALRASLARQVVESASSNPRLPEEATEEADKRILERQTLGGPGGGSIGGSARPGGGSLRGLAQSLSFRATSVESVSKYLSLEMTPPVLPSGTPQPSPDRKGIV